MEKQPLKEKELLRNFQTQSSTIEKYTTGIFNNNDLYYISALKVLALLNNVFVLFINSIFGLFSIDDNLTGFLLATKIAFYNSIALMSLITFASMCRKCYPIMLFNSILSSILFICAVCGHKKLYLDLLTLYLLFFSIPLFILLTIYYWFVKRYGPIQTNTKLLQIPSILSKENISMTNKQLSAFYINSSEDNIQFINILEYPESSNVNITSLNDKSQSSAADLLPKSNSSLFGFHQSDKLKDLKTEPLEHLNPSSFLQFPDLV